MREYGQIQCSFWNDPDIQGMSDDAKLLAVYLLAGPHSNGLGCYRLPDGYVMADLGWSSERVSKGFQEVSKTRFCDRCEATNFVLIPKFLRWNPITNGNVAKARQREFDAVPRKASIHEALAVSVLKYGAHLSEPFAKHLETVCATSSKQDPTQPNPDPNQTGEEKDLSSSRKREPDQAASIRVVFEHWQKQCKHPRAQLDDKRRKAIRNRLKDGYSVDDLLRAVDGCAVSPFHQGDNKDGRKYDDIELICRDGKHVDQFLKIADDPDAGSGLGAAGRKTAAAAREFIDE